MKEQRLDCPYDFTSRCTMGRCDCKPKEEIEKQQQGYSEEEVKRLAFDFYYDMSHKMGVPTNLISENATNVDVWFKKFKNK